MRLLAGEDINKLATELSIAKTTLEGWKKKFISGGRESLASPRRRSTAPPAVELTSGNIRQGLRELIRVAALWESGRLGTGTREARSHHERLLRELVSRANAHWDALPLPPEGSVRRLRGRDFRLFALHEMLAWAFDAFKITRNREIALNALMIAFKETGFHDVGHVQVKEDWEWLDRQYGKQWITDRSKQQGAPLFFIGLRCLAGERRLHDVFSLLRTRVSPGLENSYLRVRSARIKTEAAANGGKIQVADIVAYALDVLGAPKKTQAAILKGYRHTIVRQSNRVSAQLRPQLDAEAAEFGKQPVVSGVPPQGGRRSSCYGSPC